MPLLLESAVLIVKDINAGLNVTKLGNGSDIYPVESVNFTIHSISPHA